MKIPDNMTLIVHVNEPLSSKQVERLKKRILENEDGIIILDGIKVSFTIIGFE